VQDVQKLTTLRFEFLAASTDGAASSTHTPVAIALAAVHNIDKDEMQLLQELVVQYSVPEVYR
jgi:alpha-ketoglutarate-dependent taurine dioxygenase